MDRIITPYGSASPLDRPTLSPAWGHGHAPTSTKTSRDYLRALRRRWWLLLTLWLLVFLPGALYVLKQAPIYQAQTEIEIVPPQFDAALAVIVEHAANLNRDNSEQYVPTKIAQLKSKSLIDQVVHEFEPSDAAAASGLAMELFNGLIAKRVPGTNQYLVTLDSRDQDRVDKMLNQWIKLFAEHSKEREEETIVNSIAKASESLRELKSELTKVNTDIAAILKSVPHFAPGGRDRLEEDYLSLKTLMIQKQIRFEDLAHEQRVSEMWPELKQAATAAQNPAIAGRLSELYSSMHDLQDRLSAEKGRLRASKFNSDPYVKMLSNALKQVCDDIDELEESTSPRAMPDLGAMAVTRAGGEIGDMERKLAEIQGRIHTDAPQYQKYLALLDQQEHINKMITDQGDNLLKFQQVSETLKAPVEVWQRASMPMAPVRPNRFLNLALVIVLASGLAVGAVFALESVDRVVKCPEHVAGGLTLPLLTVVPRMKRLARIIRGGHLWTPGAPDSVEADSFRNLRASLVGVEACDRSIISILVTSAKAGDGKSTTALNLAAACARAGERTILVDCDLRRTSLAPVFDADPDIGLVDVLRGEIDWPRATVHCSETPHLDFLSAGHPGGVPVEILGSVELKQLLAALSRHYHRVILDAPAILGLADGRILGSLADATLFVVRSETHELSPLRRAKEMLEQTHARVAGVVFNDLREGLHNWSSYGPSLRARSTVASPSPVREPLGLAAPTA